MCTAANVITDILLYSGVLVYAAGKTGWKEETEHEEQREYEKLAGWSRKSVVHGTSVTLYDHDPGTAAAGSCTGKDDCKNHCK